MTATRIRPLALLCLVLLALAASLAAGLVSGSQDLTAAEVWRALLPGEPSLARDLVLEVRPPRVEAALA